MHLDLLFPYPSRVLIPKLLSDIGDYGFLTEQVVSVGLFEDKEKAKAWLDGDEKRDEVRKGIREAQMLGISGVPFFMIEYHGRVSV